METINVKPIDVSVIKEVETEVQIIANDAQALSIKTQDDFTLAGSMRMKIKGRIKELDEQRKSITQPLDIAKKNVMAMFNPILDRLNNSVEIIDQGMIIYTEEQEEKARKEQARLDEIARKEREKQEARARELEAAGKTEKAAVAQAKADAVIAPTVVTSTPKVAGQAMQERWYGEVVDFKVLPDEYKLPNQSALDKVAQAVKGKVSIPGVRFYSKKIVSGRSA